MRKKHTVRLKNKTHRKPAHTAGELVVLVDKLDNVTGYKDRYNLGSNDRMRIVVVWLHDGKGNALIHKRAAGKKVGGGLWENAAGGGVAKGETYEQAAYKELSEELGIEAVKLTFVDKTQFTSHNGPKMCAWFEGVIDAKIELKPDEREVQEVKWTNANDLFDDRDANPDNYMPSSQHWRQLFESQKNY